MRGTQTINNLEIRAATRYQLSGMANDPIQILLADDDRIMHGVLGHFIKQEGFVLRSAFDGLQALEMAVQQPPDLLILDSMMPELDGSGVLHEWRTRPNLLGIPVIMLTSKKGRDDMAGAIQEGASDYLTKPFSPDELIAKVNWLLKEGARPKIAAVQSYQAVPPTPLTPPALPQPEPPAAAFTADSPTRFQGTVRVNEVYASRDVARIAEDVIAHLLRIPGIDLNVTLVIDAKFPSGAPADLVRTVGANWSTIQAAARRAD